MCLSVALVLTPKLIDYMSNLMPESVEHSGYRCIRAVCVRVAVARVIWIPV